MRVTTRVDETVFDEAARRAKQKANAEAPGASGSARDVFESGVEAGVRRMKEELQNVTINLEAKP